MSRLSSIGKGGEKGASPEGKLMRPNFGLVVAAAIAIGIIILIVIVAALAYTVTSSQPEVEPPLNTTTTATVTTSTVSSTTSSTTTTSSSTTYTVRVTTSTATVYTATTLGKYQIAACMASRISDLYLGSTMPSSHLEAYLGEYAKIFPITDCKSKDNKETCDSSLKGYMLEDELFYGSKPVRTIGYPAVVKGDSAYIIRSPEEFEKLLECGSLNDA